MAPQVRTVADLARLLAAEEKAIAELQEKRKAIEAAIDKLAEDIKALKGGEVAVKAAAPFMKVHRGPKPGGRRPGRKPIGAKSIREAIADILTEAGEPMRAGDIAQKLVTSGYKTKSKDPRNMVSAILGQSKEFVRVRKGLYSLRK
jgi:hypothetical protein